MDEDIKINAYPSKENVDFLWYLGKPSMADTLSSWRFSKTLQEIPNFVLRLTSIASMFLAVGSADGFQ